MLINKASCRKTAMIVLKDRFVNHGDKEALEAPTKTSTKFDIKGFLAITKTPAYKPFFGWIAGCCLALMLSASVHLAYAAEASSVSEIVTTAPLQKDKLDATFTEAPNQSQWFYIAPQSRSIYSRFFTQLKQQFPQKNIFRLANSALVQCAPSANEKFFIAAGILALEQLQDCTKQAKIFAFYISQQQFYELDEKYPGKYQQANILFVDQPLKRQLALSQFFLPKAKNVGIIYSSSVEVQIESLVLSNPKGFIFNTHKISPQDNLISELPKTTIHSDFLLALIDNNIYNSSNAKSILLTTYRKGIALFGGTRGFVKAGIVASCYSVPEQLLKELISTIKNSSNITGLRKYPEHFEIIQNKAVSHSLNLPHAEDSTIKDFIKKKLQFWDDLNDK